MKIDIDEKELLRTAVKHLIALLEASLDHAIEHETIKISEDSDILEDFILMAVAVSNKERTRFVRELEQNPKKCREALERAIMNYSKIDHEDGNTKSDERR